MKPKIILFLALLFFPVANISAYSPETTHAGLAEQSVFFYNKNFTRQISDKEKEFIIEGAIAEDRPVLRTLNHFYDPIRNIGINNYRHAKDWATLEYTDNVYTWGGAINEYAKGNKENAFIYLGHILHLIEDMTVPDHTRNDPHMGALNTGESSYEDWAKKSKNRATLSGLSNTYLLEKPIFFNDIIDYFDFLANYSNRNFFGDDSIKNNVYQYEYPKITNKDRRFVYSIDSIYGKEFAVLNLRIDRRGNEELFLVDDEKTDVLSGYFDRLGKQAILAGAGVIDLFFREAEVARTDYLKKQSEEFQKETQNAIELNKKLQNSNIVGLTLYGVSYLVNENIISPTSAKIYSIKNGLVSGVKIVGSTLSNTSSLISFTASALAKDTVSEISSVFASPSDTKKIATAVSAKNSIPSISTAINSFANNSAITAPEIIKENITEDTNLPETETLSSDYLKELSEAYSLLSSLKEAVPTVAPKIISVITLYSPGFGGGEAPKVSVSEEEITKTVDKGVDKVVDNSNQEEEKTVDEPQDVVSTTEDEIVENEATTTESTLLDEVIEFITPVLDTTPPDISLTINSCADSLSDTACLLATTTIEATWRSDADDLSYFEIKKDTEISTTTDTSIIFEVADKTSHKFSVSAVDKADNISEQVSKSFEIFKNPVVINEVAWGGTSGHPEDEWLELYNLSNQTITLDNWILSSKTDKSLKIILSGTISPNGFYLIERKNDDETDEATQSPIKNITADLWTSFGSGIFDSGESLVLSRASTTIDEVPYSLNWNGAVVKTLSAERCLDCGIYNWSINNSEIRNGLNVSGSPIYGTPRSRNYRDYLIPISGVSGDFTLLASKSPYLVPKSSTLTIREGVNFNIEPGVTIKFGDGASIRSEGKISANGTAEKPIVFTAFSDDDYGGDMNSDGMCGKGNASSTASCPSVGKWYGVILLSKEKSSIFKNTIFRYGGLNYGTTKGMICADSSSVDIFDSVFEYSGSDGVGLKNSSGQILGNTFKKNNAILSGNGLSVSLGAPMIKNNNFIENSVGLYLYGSSADVVDNIFDGNTSKGISVVGKPGNTMTGNRSVGGSLKTGDLINLTSNISSLNSTTALLSNPMPYFISGTLQVPLGSTLHIYEGVKIMGTSIGTNSRFLINGELFVLGSETSPVVFSSNLETPTKSGWHGIQAGNGSRVDIKNAVFKDATSGITYYKSPIILENILFSNNQLGISIGQFPSPLEKAINVIFESDNNATTSPKGIW
ncbi:MAG: Polymorphic membrane protein [Parcubacteria group bacterium GW2011_GWF2_38_76]|nr:MAG: Polymorphic membrane protein [Parcubacteria group bacterium GW2011_GWF2_38_76]HBM45891.1 hypothetical protein [Patescibacteria group bacterium]